MATIRDAQLGELTLEDGEFQTTINHSGRKIPFSIEIDDADGLEPPIDLLPVKLEAMLAQAIARVRSEDEYWVGEYVEHHLEQIEPDDWKGVLPEGEAPSAAAVRRRLSLRRVWGTYDEDGLSLNLDHGLPAALTDYVVVVRIDAEGEIDEITMES